MKHSSAAVVSIFALALLAACGGGGSSPDPDLAAARTSQAAGMVAPAADGIAAQAGQRGSGWVAPAGSELDPLVASRLQEELDQIESALRQAATAGVEKQEALELVSDTRAELRKERPNRLRLRGLLAGLGYGVQVLDGLKGAGKLLGPLAAMI